MPQHNGLIKANKAKKDEFYTNYDVIQSELNYYEDKFDGKTVLYVIVMTLLSPILQSFSCVILIT